MNWIIPANGKKYRHAEAFDTWGFIDWRDNGRKFQIGDYAYIYCAKPYQRVMFKTQVKEIHLTKDEIINDKAFWFDKSEYERSLSGTYVRLCLIARTDNPALSLEQLEAHGLRSAPYNARRISDSLQEYIDKFFDDYYHDNVFPDSANTQYCVEGAKVAVFVNKYERSSIARLLCIEHLGCYCHICGINFERVYGEIGKDFIHVHHLKPLNKIDTEYIVDYEKDLLPVCPNCHAMLHRRINGKYPTIDELRNITINEQIPKNAQKDPITAYSEKAFRARTACKTQFLK